MSETILDNQEVTAEVLNDMAIDLGATSFNGFGNEKFGTNALNEITSALVSKGILNSDNKCMPVLGTNTVTINTGTIVFATGAKKKISEPISVNLEPNTYIYALNDTVTNTCSIVISSTEPTSGDYVMIAAIDVDGKLVDKRNIATAKVAFPTAPGAIKSETQQLTFKFKQHFTYTYEMGTESFSYVLCPTEAGKLCIDVSSGNETANIVLRDYRYASFQKQGSSVVVTTTYNGSGGTALELSFMVI